MESPIHDETLSAENYPYRCGIGQGCPHLFLGSVLSRGANIFMKPGPISALARNPKCPYSAREVGRSIVRRVDDKDW